MAIKYPEGTVTKPFLSWNYDVKTDTQSFSASSSLTTISGLTVNIAAQNSGNYFYIIGQLTIGCGNATSVIATLQADGDPIDALRGAADGSRLRSTSRGSQDSTYEAHTIPLVGIWAPNSTSSIAFTIGGSTNAGTFWVNRSDTSNNDTSRDSTRSFSSLQVFEMIP
tara:strand:- start:386 stop:886 length:501 start_codon:yes stop_codon:yes gene_type:complete